MKATILTALLCALPVVVAAQAVEQGDSTVRVPAPLSIDLPAKALSTALTNWEGYKGAYDLSDGRIISLTQRGRTMYAEIDGREKVQVIAADMNTFVAMDRSLKLNLNRNFEGEVRGDVLLASPAATAGLPAAPVLLTFGAQ
ncbi:MAG TPA: hypothetical protein VGF27_23295 [Pseudoduganella sp.]